MSKTMNDIERIALISLKIATKSDVPTTPKIYKRIFEEVCKSEGCDVEEICNDEATKKIIDESILKLDTLMKELKSGLNQLQNSTQKAYDAILNQNLETIKTSQEDVKKLQDRLKELEKELYTDSLTSVHNRKYLDEKVLDINGKFKNSGFMAIVDLDKFKFINDTYGHSVGDKVLKIISSKLTYLGNLDIIRYGGDEFIILLKSEIIDKSLDKFLSDKLMKLQKELTEKAFSHQNKFFHVLFSFGISEFKKGDNFEKILDKVDSFMYKNKEDEK